MAEKKGFDLGDYVEVKDRIRIFYELFGQGRLVTTLVRLTTEPDGKPRVWVEAAAYRTPDDPLPGRGNSWMELPGKTSYTAGSEIENVETSAWGRAIGALGILIDRSIATSNEIENKRDADVDPSRVDKATGEIRTANGKATETEHLIGTLTRTGKIARGDSPGSDLQYRMEPDGHSLHFRLEIPGKDDQGNPKNIPQVWAGPEIAETMYAAGIDVEKLKGEKAVCTGLVYGVSYPGRRTYHRMKLTRLQVAEIIVPPADVSPLRALPDDEKADLDALEVPWPELAPA